MLIAVCHSAETGWTAVEDHSLLSDLRQQTDNVLWAETDVGSLTQRDIDVIAEEFDLHPLAVEDAMHTRQRPKTEHYEPHTFIVLHQLDEVESQLEPRQIACFIGERFVLTIHDGATRLLEETKARWRAADGADLPGPGFLIYTLLDVIVDDYQRIADRLEVDIEDLEEIVLETPTTPVERQVYAAKQQLSRLRRFALPSGRVVEQFLHPPMADAMTRETVEGIHDVYDHTLRIAEQVRNIEDLSQAVLDLNRSAQERSLHEVTKKLTGWAAIIAIPTLISSFYGMNFELLPNENSIAGFWFAVATMLGTGLILYAFFKRRGWI